MQGGCNLFSKGRSVRFYVPESALAESQVELFRVSPICCFPLLNSFTGRATQSRPHADRALNRLDLIQDRIHRNHPNISADWLRYLRTSAGTLRDRLDHDRLKV